MALPLLQVEGLSFRYRRATEPALRDITLSLEGGEVLLVAGPSGCGKSTLIRAINGLIPHSYSGELAGRVLIDGRSTADLRLRELALLVGTVLQDPARQVVGSTVRAELAFGPENLGVPRSEIVGRMEEVVRRAGIGPIEHRSTSELSGGELQLLAVAGALMLRPRLYVVDEPLANLDPASAARLLGLLRKLADDGHAIVIVEHRVEEALDMRPDRILYLDAGNPAFLGPVDAFLTVADPSVVKVPFDAVLAKAGMAVTGSAVGEIPAAESRTRAALLDPPRLAYDDVNVWLGENHVLRNLSTSLGQQEIVAVLGPNGSGKTTMFRTAMHLIARWAGRVLVDGRSVADLTVAELARTFGYVFQSPSQMLFARTVRDELLFGPRNLGIAIGEADEIAVDALRRTSLNDVEGILDRPPLTLSFGQQKRLALAIALAWRPPTLILDEPSAGQDYRSSALFMGSVIAIPELESLYFITHDVDLALTHADRILLLREGRVVADGPPLEVVSDEDRWRATNLRRTSLVSANLEWRHVTGRFLNAIELARLVASKQAGRGKEAQPSS